jgi:hypothetical protein
MHEWLSLVLLLLHAVSVAAGAASSGAVLPASHSTGRNGKDPAQRPAVESRTATSQKSASISMPERKVPSTGSALELASYWSAPSWSSQGNGTVCAPMPLDAFLRLQALFAEVAGLLATLGVHWIISHGSLLGAWLHHGPVPWDEEGDIVLLPEDFARLHSALGPPPDAKLRRASGGRMSLYEGPTMGALQYDYHEHTEEGGRWLATAVTFRHASEPRDSSVHVDAFLARTNGTHAWTDSAVMPLQVLLPIRRIRFYDWLVPAPFDTKAALHLWYGPHFVGRRKCALRQPGGEAAGIEQIAEVSGLQISQSYPLVKNEWLSDEALRCTVHLNRSVLWVLDIHTQEGRVLEVSGLPQKPRLEHLGTLAPYHLQSKQVQDNNKYRHNGPFPVSIPNMWD